ncbi:rRNA maturation RNase YbeY [Treponema sp.]|uniref:rRNA maturation RNase YbeY n=1 Tax=Treponema sp. TaxID=166 RepID=UPI00298E2D8D|nr:rRNA maturation RNase YbeY [Treponema sp.]MCR5614440.1 rRNA maturation RNase YbeY [Treponema sp.]
MANRVVVTAEENITSPIWLDKVESFVLFAMEKLKFDCEEVSILFCNDSYIKELNKCYRNIDNATDVLSFENDMEYEDEGTLWKAVGDIVISVDMIAENARYFNTTENAELKRLLVHGLLHLNGMDHGEEHIEANKAPECEMLVLQESLLKELQEKIIIG